MIGPGRARIVGLMALALGLGLIGPGANGPAAAQPADADPVARGAYIFNAAGCLGCHTDVKGGGKPLAGGRPLATPFGTFYSPNITPDPEHGIGRWSDADFIRALREGKAPDGSAYFPAFPYASFTHMTEADMLALKAYLSTREPVNQPNRPHDVGPPFGWRFLIPVWQTLYLDPGPLPPVPDRDGEWHRGRYLVEALGHCAECHTPRHFLGGLDTDRRFAGSPAGPEGKSVPNITPDPQGGIGNWSVGDITTMLEIGMMPDGDFAGGGMNEVVQNSTSKLTPEDRRAIAAYLKALPPVAGKSGGGAEAASR
jgi:mono/diheme cytochrome c family protein